LGNGYFDESAPRTTGSINSTNWPEPRAAQRVVSWEEQAVLASFLGDVRTLHGVVMQEDGKISLMQAVVFQNLACITS